MSSDPRVGTTIAGYEVQAVIGRSDTAVVYLAEHPRISEKVALKVLSPDIDDDGFRDRFLRDAQIAASLEHPNVIRIFEADEHFGQLFVAMAFIRGTDLYGVLEREGPLALRRASSVVGQLAAALDAAHAKDLIHRDVNPANVLIAPPTAPDRREHVYLTDFGMARFHPVAGLPSTSLVEGSLHYSAPEQFVGRPADARADVYSLGCVLYECLTGEPPYPREQEASVMYGHTREPVPRVTAVRPDLPARLDEVIGVAMAKRPEDRFARATDLAKAATLIADRRSASIPQPQASVAQVAFKAEAPRRRGLFRRSRGG